jgi:crotonobetainyl-CoA:carnitine CoA-transferase CaiB-like acyl-CoA transferase
MPLSGIRVVDLTRILAGPYATMILGDMGADVIKVENPDGGDDTRGWGPPWVPQAGGASAYYTAVNRNKRSVALDLKSDAGREVLWVLIERADVVASNFRPGVIERLGFGWEEVHARAPRIVYALINGYGATGPGAEKPSFDVIVQGESGVMDVTASGSRSATRRRGCSPCRGSWLRSMPASGPAAGSGSRSRSTTGSSRCSRITRRTCGPAARRPHG